MPISVEYGPNAVNYGTAVSSAAETNNSAEQLRFLMQLYQQLEEQKRQQGFQSGEAEKTRAFESEESRKERELREYLTKLQNPNAEKMMRMAAGPSYKHSGFGIGGAL